ncbi:LCP family protein [Bacillus sp. NTK074B]|uniref:LCP family protein n=1 Tax=Bacillus sp. NTK074B TaxID=2802174 RepID=UPI001A8E2F14|nr:LCP family protein [Bacillus sp. NTK074B]
MYRQDIKSYKRRKKRKILKRVFLLLFIAIAFVGSILGYLMFQSYQAASDTYDDFGRDKSKMRDEAVTILEDPVSILIMGIEDYSSGGHNGRSDTLMVATFNPDDGKMQLLSIPRDTLVDIADMDVKTKINAAYAYGGKENTIETVENFLDIPIDYYVTVNFDAFKNIVDVLGGITVDVPFNFTQNSDDRVAEKLEFTEGPMDLDGREALAYARMRLQDPMGDLGRNERQKQVVESVIDELASAKTLLKVDELSKEVGKNIETNLKVSDGLAFYRKYSDFNSSNIDTLKLEGTPEYIDGISYFVPDEEELVNLQDELKSHLKHGKTSKNENE